MTNECVCYQLLVVNLLPDELVFAQRVASLARDGVDRPLLHLLLDGAVEHEERLASALLAGSDTNRQEVRWTESSGVVWKKTHRQQDLTRFPAAAGFDWSHR